MQQNLSKITIKDIRFINELYESCIYDTLCRNLCLTSKQLKNLSYMICSSAFYSLKYQYEVE